MSKKIKKEKNTKNKIIGILVKNYFKKNSFTKSDNYLRQVDSLAT